jgi:hypothetical protein
MTELRPHHGHLNADGTAKAVFPDRRTARKVRNQMNSRVGRRLNIYRCGEADHFHLGNPKDALSP